MNIKNKVTSFIKHPVTRVVANGMLDGLGLSTKVVLYLALPVPMLLNRAASAILEREGGLYDQLNVGKRMFEAMQKQAAAKAAKRAPYVDVEAEVVA